MASYVSTLSSFNEGGNQSLQNTVVTQQQSIIGLQTQIDNIQTEVTGLNVGLTNIGGLIQRDSILEQNRLIQEQNKEKLLDERNIRLGKEKEIEQTVTSSLVAPLQRLEPRLNSVLSGITGALASLFGFLGTGIIQGISNLAKFSIKGLTSARDLVTRVLSNVGGVISSLRGGFNTVINGLSSITRKVSSIALNLAKSPIKFIADLFAKVPGLLKGGVKKAASGAGELLDDFLKIGSKAVPAIVGGAALTALDVSKGEDLGRAAFGTATGMLGSAAAFAGGSLLPIPGSGLLTGALAYNPAEEFGKKVYDYTTTNLNPKAFLSNIKNNLNLNLNFDTNKFLGGLSQGAKSLMNNLGMGNLVGKGPTSTAIQGKVEDNTNVQPEKPNKPSVQPAPKNPPLVGNLSEPKPDVIVASSLSENQSQVQSLVQDKPITDVPLISSANIDNFYTLYSQTQYNVVM